jgi:hypothetical protein
MNDDQPKAKPRAVAPGLTAKDGNVGYSSKDVNVPGFHSRSTTAPAGLTAKDPNTGYSSKDT